MKISMVIKILLVLFFGCNSFNAYSQSDYKHVQAQILEHFANQNWDTLEVTKDTLYRGMFTNKWNVSISENMLQFDSEKLVIKNPYYSDKYESSDKNFIKNFPKSFSIIYEGKLISLFENGKFGCYDLNNFERDTVLENRLNTRKFSYQWLIDGKISALSRNSLFQWDGKSWLKSKDVYPITKRSLLFDDADYIVFGDCHGEWGGTVYFQNKTTRKIYFTGSTCTNTVNKDINGYNVLASLGHGSGVVELKTIPDPTKLSKTSMDKIGKTSNGEALGYTDKSKAFGKALEFHGFQIFSNFKLNERELFIVHLAELAFLAEIKNNDIQIVNPLFLSDLYTHNPVTREYGDYILINLDHNGTGREREISVILIHKNKIQQLDWNEDHSR